MDFLLPVDAKDSVDLTRDLNLAREVLADVTNLSTTTSLIPLL